jgi:formylglycine-generating enzyme required for sulfatase activity
VRIKPGTFMMGSPEGEPDRDADEVQHRVTLTRDFLMQATEVTQGQYQEVMGYNPSRNSSCGGECPVESVSWHESAAYCNALSAREVLSSCYRCSGSGPSVTCEPVGNPYQCAGYRLPTEAEWEYAARAGTTGPRYGDVNAVAWYDQNSGSTLHPVRQKQPNAWGLYDMLGNVWEWSHDWYTENPGGATDPWGPGAGSYRVVRGGSWLCDAGYVRAASRFRFTSGTRYNDLGFRPSKTVPR